MGHPKYRQNKTEGIYRICVALLVVLLSVACIAAGQKKYGPLVEPDSTFGVGGKKITTLYEDENMKAHRVVEYVDPRRKVRQRVRTDYSGKVTTTKTESYDAEEKLLQKTEKETVFGSPEKVLKERVEDYVDGVLSAGVVKERGANGDLVVTKRYDPKTERFEDVVSTTPRPSPNPSTSHSDTQPSPREKKNESQIGVSPTVDQCLVGEWESESIHYSQRANEPEDNGAGILMSFATNGKIVVDFKNMKPMWNKRYLGDQLIWRNEKWVGRHEGYVRMTPYKTFETISPKKYEDVVLTQDYEAGSFETSMTVGDFPFAPASDFVCSTTGLVFSELISGQLRVFKFKRIGVKP